MAEPSATNIERVPGILYKDPTDLSSQSTYGTALGAASGVYLAPGMRTELVTAAEFGGEPVEGLYLGEGWRVGAMLRSMDADALQTVFPNTVLGTGGTIRGLTAPGSTRAGTLLSTRTVKLLYAPHDASHFGLLLYRAMPLVEEQAEVMNSILSERQIPVMFVAMRDATGRVGQVLPLSEMTL